MAKDYRYRRLNWNPDTDSLTSILTRQHNIDERIIDNRSKEKNPINRIKFIFEKPPKDFVYPCTIRQIKSKLTSLPGRFVEPINIICFCNQRNKALNTHASASTFTGEIKIYAVHKSLTMFYTTSKPSTNYIQEYRQYGAEIKHENNDVVVQFNKETITAYYLDNVLLHEIAHLLGASGSKKGEQTAERFVKIMQQTLNQKI